MLCKPVQQGGADVATWDSSGAEEHESKVESGEEEVGASRDAEGNAAEEGASLETAGERMTASGEAADVEAAGTRAVEVDPLPRLMEAFELIMCDVDEVSGCSLISNRVSYRVPYSVMPATLLA